jgi:hypothetical protein
MNKHQDYSEVQVNKRNYLIIPCKLGVFFDYVSKFLHLFLSQIAQENGVWNILSYDDIPRRGFA